MKKDFQIVFGRHPVLDALNGNQPVDKVLLQQGTRGELEVTLRHLCKEKNVALQNVPKEKLNFLVRGNHQGVVAFISPITFSRVEDVVPFLFEKGVNPAIAVLDGITDVRNFGAIARSAEVMGFHAIVIPTKGGAQINADAVKASAGALLKIPVCKEPSLVNAMIYLKNSGLQVVSSALDGAKPMGNLDLKGPTAVVIGAEGSGVSKGVQKESNSLFFIPQLGETDSLNASVASGIIFYELQRQRGFQK
ncbi:MAG: 23S rRNA (guanosine(2251)-2'-O)-methyltransferase RlmB [Saprospiraceae bacterium]